MFVNGRLRSIIENLNTAVKNVVPDETCSAAADVEACSDLRPSSSVLQLTRMVRESARKTFDALAEAFGQPYSPALGRGAGTAYVGSRAPSNFVFRARVTSPIKQAVGIQSLLVTGLVPHFLLRALR